MDFTEILLKIFTPINLIFLAAILYLGYEDYKSFSTDDYKNYKQLIINIGILGTFVGIFWGLLNFEAQNLESIQKSIPPLLDGLRTAFVTSIFGILAALILTFVQKQFSEKTYSDDGTEILRSMDQKLRHLNSIESSSKETKEEIKNLNNEYSQNNAMLVEILENNFEKVNESLEKSIKKISEGATKEIVVALKEVIEKFNEEISTGFGDNFKELNQAIGNLLEWQKQHSKNLQLMQESLETAVDSIKGTDRALTEIASKNDQIIEVYQFFTEIIDKYQEQSMQMNTRIMTQIELTEIMKKGIDETKVKLNQFLKEFSEGSTGVSAQFNDTTESLKNLTKSIEKELPRSLGSLEHNLVKLTDGFKDDYKTFLEYYKNLVITQE